MNPIAGGHPDRSNLWACGGLVCLGIVGVIVGLQPIASAVWEAIQGDNPAGRKGVALSDLLMTTIPMFSIAAIHFVLSHFVYRRHRTVALFGVALLLCLGAMLAILGLRLVYNLVVLKQTSLGLAWYAGWLVLHGVTLALTAKVAWTSPGNSPEDSRGFAVILWKPTKPK
jgi:hypothetical protein